MVRVLFAVVLMSGCAATLVSAADLPYFPVHQAAVHLKKITKPKVKVAQSAQKTGPNPLLAAPLPAKAKLPAPVSTPVSAVSETKQNLTWVLPAMVAHADGGKQEGSASAVGNIVVDKPGPSFGPQIVIELEGHIVKTIQSTARLDIHVGSIEKSLVWNADEIKSGVFKITLIEKAPGGSVPPYIPVSAIAFVTKSGDGHAVMVSLDKIVLHFGTMDVISTK